MSKEMETRVGELERTLNTLGHDDLTGVWLEVADVQFETGDPMLCKVQLKTDKAYPKPRWWPVTKDALGSGKNELEVYKEILREIDKKRIVLARLRCGGDDAKGHALECDRFRFQSAELGSRTS